MGDAATPKARRRWRSALLALLLLLAGLVAGIALCFHLQRRAAEHTLKQRRDGAAPVRPTFLRDRLPCRAPTPAALRLDRAMLTVARAADAVDPTGNAPVQGQVVSYFAWGWRQTGAARCAPADAIVRQLAAPLDRHNWPLAAELLDLSLVERLPPSSVRARGLAGIAFLGWIPPSDLGGEDARPTAFRLLAEQGRFALPWREAALRRLGGSTRIETGAAYLAVATAPAAALPRVERVMAAKLQRSIANATAAYQDGREVPALTGDDGNRLIELGYALARGGAGAQPFAEPVVAMLEQRIARAAPPFGLMAAEPTEFCRIARHIGGRPVQAAARQPFCRPGFQGGDGAPKPF